MSFDYTLHEWELDEPFVCESTGRTVRGFVALSEDEQEAAHQMNRRTVFRITSFDYVPE